MPWPIVVNLLFPKHRQSLMGLKTYFIEIVGCNFTSSMIKVSIQRDGLIVTICTKVADSMTA